MAGNIGEFELINVTMMSKLSAHVEPEWNLPFWRQRERERVVAHNSTLRPNYIASVSDVYCRLSNAFSLVYFDFNTINSTLNVVVWHFWLFLSVN